MLGGPEFHRRLKEAVIRKIDHERDGLLIATDWPDYVERRGRIRALAWALEEMNDITKKMESIGS